MPKKPLFYLLSILVISGHIQACKNHFSAHYKTACFDNHCIQFERARSKSEKRTGLMHRPHLKSTEGMIFEWTTEQPRAMWMKNTLINLDMIWLNKKQKIVHIHQNAKPHDKTPIYPSTPAMYILEIPAGLSKTLKLQLGQSISFKQPL